MIQSNPFSLWCKGKLPMFYCDYLNRKCDGMTQYEKSCSLCPSYRYNVVIPNKWNDDDAFDRARDFGEPRHGKRKYEPILKPIEKENEAMARKKENQTTALVELQGLNESQIAIVTQQTPKHLIKQRKGRAGKVFDYLPHAEVAKILNQAFNHAWSFETEPILQFCNDTEMTVKGVLTIYGQDGKTITKEQYGSQEIPRNRQGDPTMTFGEALKGAASDSLKKCASLLGIALDLYAFTVSLLRCMTP